MQSGNTGSMSRDMCWYLNAQQLCNVWNTIYSDTFSLLILWPHPYKKADFDIDIAHKCYPMFFTNVLLILHATTMYAVTYLFPRAAIVKHSCTSHSLFIQSSYWQIPQNHSPMRITPVFEGQIQIQIHKAKYIYAYKENSIVVLHTCVSSRMLNPKCFVA